jgi:SnoaL-like polyketide cyclase
MAEKELEAAASGFLDTAFNLGEPETAVSEHVGDKFVQHNPQVADGAAAFITFVHSMRSQFPEMHLEIKRVITQTGTRRRPGRRAKRSMTRSAPGGSPIMRCCSGSAACRCRCSWPTATATP